MNRSKSIYKIQLRQTESSSKSANLHVESDTGTVEGFLVFLGVTVIYVVRIKTVSFKRNT